MAQIIPFPADAEEPELEALSREELLALAQELREKLAALDAREPEDMMSKAYERWGERHEALEDALDDLLELLDETEPGRQEPPHPGRLLVFYSTGSSCRTRAAWRRLAFRQP